MIPKPQARSEFKVKGWGTRRGQRALIYTIPNHSNPAFPHEKGVTCAEWEQAYARLLSTGEFTKPWFDNSMPACGKEGSCNFTTIGGIFELLGHASYADRGRYKAISEPGPRAA